MTRIIFIIGLILFSIYIFVQLKQDLLAAFVFLFAVYFIYKLFKYIDRINGDLKRFLTSIKYSDFTQTYLKKNFGTIYGELYNSLVEMYSELSSNRIKAEENLQYLKTLIELIPSGILSYTKNGHIELINKAAKRILNIGDFGNINSIKKKREYFGLLFENQSHGVEKTIKFYDGVKEKTVSVYVSYFKIRNQLYTLMTLKDLADEIEKKRLENEMSIAQNVQSSLLPNKVPEYKDYEISTFFRPAKRVGGDFYDFFELGQNKLGIVIGDVSGKGLGAAIYTTLIKGIFQTLAYEYSSTSELLIKVNSIIYKMLDRKSFITAIYGVLDISKNTLTFSRAGHEPLLLYENSLKEFKVFSQSGLGLGLDKGEALSNNLKEHEIYLNEEDTIMLYTDGLVDLYKYSVQKNNGNYFKEIVSGNYSKGTSQIMKELENIITDYTSSYEQFDDITIIMIKRKLKVKDSINSSN